MSNSGLHLSLFGVTAEDRETGFTQELKTVSKDVDALFVTSHPKGTPWKTQVRTFFKNPVVILLVWIQHLFQAVKESLGRGERDQKYMTAKVVSDSEDIPLYHMEDNVFPVVKQQGLIWLVPSWLYVIALLSTLAEFLITANPLPLLTGIIVAGLFAFGFLRTSRTERDLRRVREITATAAEHELENAVLIGTNDVVKRLKDVLKTGNVTYTVR